MEDIINTLPPKDDTNHLTAKHALAKQINNTLVALGQHGMDVTGPQFDKVRKILSMQDK